MTDRVFWQNFFQTTWERKPSHLGSELEPLLSPDELFTLAVVVAESLAGGNDRVRVRWCDDGRRTRNLAPEASSAELLPQRSDRSIEGYCERMSRLETFFFQIPTLHLFQVALWPRIARLCRMLQATTGTPGHMTWTDAYFGRYKSTPFGVHLDGASNFTFGVTGHKTFYLWEPDYYHAHMSALSVHDFFQFIPDAVELTVGPGEVIYWPSRYYHVAVPDGQFSVSMNLALYPELPQAAWLTRAFQRTLEGLTAMQGPVHSLELPEALAHACGTAVERVSGGALQRNLLEAIVAHRTRFGFADPPPQRASTRLESGDRVIRASVVELVCVPDSMGGLIVSSNGYAIGLPESATVRRTIESLNEGQRIEVQQETQPLIEHLYTWGAVERYWA